MHRYFPAHALWAATALLAAGPALALSTATSRLADFRIGLTDLDPADGVVPTLVLNPGTGGFASTAFARSRRATFFSAS